MYCYVLVVLCLLVLHLLLFLFVSGAFFKTDPDLFQGYHLLCPGAKLSLTIFSTVKLIPSDSRRCRSNTGQCIPVLYKSVWPRVTLVKSTQSRKAHWLLTSSQESQIFGLDKISDIWFQLGTQSQIQTTTPLKLLFIFQTPKFTFHWHGLLLGIKNLDGSLRDPVLQPDRYCPDTR